MLESKPLDIQRLLEQAENSLTRSTIIEGQSIIQHYEFFERLLNSKEESLKELAFLEGEEILEQNPEAYWIRYKMAEILSKQRFCTKAIEQLKIALSSIPPGSEIDDKYRIMCLKLIADSYYNKGSYIYALMYYHRLFEIDTTKYSYCQLMIGECYIELGQPENALNSFNNVGNMVENKKIYLKSQYRKMEVLIAEKRVKEAKDVLALIIEHSKGKQWIMAAKQLLSQNDETE